MHWEQTFTQCLLCAHSRCSVHISLKRMRLGSKERVWEAVGTFRDQEINLPNGM